MLAAAKRYLSTFGVIAAFAFIARKDLASSGNFVGLSYYIYAALPGCAAVL